MDTIPVNEVAYGTFILNDYTETGITGRVSTDFQVIEVYLLPNASTYFAPTLIEIGNGEYAVSFVPTVTGYVSMHIKYDQAGIEREFLGSFHVVDDVTVGPLIGTQAGGVTLANLIRSTALRANDLIDTSASETRADLNTWKDDLNLNEDDNYFEGMELYITSGSSIGSTHRVIGSSDGVLTFTPPLSTPIQIGTTGELYNRRGVGFRRQEYKNVINMCIREGGSNAYNRTTQAVATMVDGTNPTFTVPANMSHICKVQYQDAFGDWHDIRRNPHNGWSYDRGNLLVWLHGGSLSIATNKALKVKGYAPNAELVNDSDRTGVDAEWLTQTAAWILQNSNPENAGNLAPGQFLSNRADALRGKMVTVMDAGCVKV